MSHSSAVSDSSQAVQADSQDLDLDDRVLPLSSEPQPDSEPEVASLLTKSKKLNISVTSLLTPDLSFTTEALKTPGISLISPVLPISHHIAQLATHSASDEVPTRGTPSAIGVLKLHRESLIPYATPFRNQKLNSNPPQVLCSDVSTIKVGSIVIM